MGAFSFVSRAGVGRGISSSASLYHLICDASSKLPSALTAHPREGHVDIVEDKTGKGKVAWVARLHDRVESTDFKPFTMLREFQVRLAPCCGSCQEFETPDL